ncbi:MAG: hypothetical protein VKP72_06990 [bacterium]|nr:hypothetical protein [bacterium]
MTPVAPDCLSGPVLPATADLPPDWVHAGPLAIHEHLRALWGGMPLRWAIVSADGAGCRIEGAVWRARQA